MAKERARRRAEREREASRRAEQRAAERAKVDRRNRRRAALRRWLPRRRRRPDSALARTRRMQNRAVLGGVLVVQLVGWLLFSSIRASVALAVLTVIALPVVVTLAFDRRA